MTTLELVDCGPYMCRLTEAACIQRHTLANATPRGNGRKANEIHQAKLKFRHCMGCEDGAQRAAGESVGETHHVEPRGEGPGPTPEPNIPAPTPAISKKEKTVALKTCAVIDCANEFQVGYGMGNRKYCDEHRTPVDRAGLEVEGGRPSAASEANQALERATVDDAPSAPPRKRTAKTRPKPATPDAQVDREIPSPRVLLELAGYQVDEVATPAGVALFVRGQVA